MAQVYFCNTFMQIGTDAGVFVQLFGKDGETEEIKLNNSKNNFERGQTDVFGFEKVSLGELKKLRYEIFFQCSKSF